MQLSDYVKEFALKKNIILMYILRVVDTTCILLTFSTTHTSIISVATTEISRIEATIVTL